MEKSLTFIKLTSRFGTNVPLYVWYVNNEFPVKKLIAQTNDAIEGFVNLKLFRRSGGI